MNEQEKENGLLSVIVPVYNVEKYLPKCLESLVKQTYPNIEIILVDDGSKDKSGGICDEYAKKYGNIRVIHQANGGVSKARNTGLREARGEYIAFVDADDFIDLDMYEILMRNLKRYDCDISACQLKYEYSLQATYKTRNDKIPAAQVFKGNDNVVKSLLAPCNGIQGYTPNKIYKRECVENVFFNEKHTMLEDVMFSWDIIWGNKVKSACLVDTPMYHYWMNPNSAIHTASPEKYRKALLAWEIMLRDIAGTELEKDCIVTALSNYINWNKAMCKCAIDNHFDEKRYFKLAKQNIQKYREYIGILPYPWTRFSARLILHSWKSYKAYYRLTPVAKKVRAAIKAWM